MNLRPELFYVYNPAEEKLETAIGFKLEETAKGYITKGETTGCKVVTGAELIKDGIKMFDIHGNLYE